MKFEGEMVDEIKENIPEAPHLKVKRFMEEYGLREEDARVITSELELADAFEEVAESFDPEAAALWMRMNSRGSFTTTG